MAWSHRLNMLNSTREMMRLPKENIATSIGTRYQKPLIMCRGCQRVIAWRPARKGKPQYPDLGKCPDLGSAR